MRFCAIFWIFTAAAIMLTLAACAIEEEPTPTTESAQIATDTAVPTEEPEPTDTPEPEPTPTVVPELEVTAVPDPTLVPTLPPNQLDNVAPIVNDEGGPVSITGVVTYTNPFFTTGVTAPMVILEDQAGFVDRDEHYIFPVESQALGQITSDFLDSPFSYSIALPIEPQGAYRDVDHDGVDEIGVQIYAVAYWTNIYGDPFLEERDLAGGGWSTAYASTRISTDPEKEREIVGGTFLIFAPDSQQSFPSGFGEDGLLFTEDDPIVNVPFGYTIVNLDSDPFTFDRSRNPVIDLIEPEGAALVDYSEDSYTDAFNSLVDQLINEYAFTDYKNIDWEGLRSQFLPDFTQADNDNDADLYLRALRDFAWSIPDGHISGPFLGDEFRQNVLGGIGIAIRELDDGTVLVTFLLENGPADDAGIALGAEITEINGEPIDAHISNTVGYNAPFSTAHSERLDKQLFSTRFPIGSEVDVSYINPGQTDPQTAVLTAGSELDSYFYWLENDDRDGFELPVEYQLLEEGIGYVQIFSFTDNSLLAVTLWERMIRAMKDNNVPAVIIDMRTNGGGLGGVANNMSAYFFDETFPLGNSSTYDDERGEFFTDPEDVREFILPPEELRYHGRAVVLVGPDCASACEFFSYNFTITDRATIIGHYPTAGLGGSVDDVAMPENVTFRFTQGRAVDPDGNIHIEGIGVVPDIRVPVNSETIFQDDAVLEAAITFLVGETIEKGTIDIDDEISDTLLPGQRFQYELSLVDGDVISILLDSNDGQNLILTILDENGNVLAETDPDTRNGFVDIDLGEDLTFFLEISAEDNTQAVEFTLSVPRS